MSFNEDIHDFIEDRLNEYEGEKFYGADLADELTDNENQDGCWILYTDKAIDYIFENRWAASSTFTYFKDELSMAINPFEDPEKYTYFMLYYGVREIVSDLPYVQAHWDEEITLTKDVIAQIIEESKQKRV